MISFTVRMKFGPEDRAEVEKILKNLGAASRREKGCVNYVAHFVESEPNTVVIYEQYRDAEALELHRASSHFEQYATEGLYRKTRERSVETLIAVT